MGVDVDELGFTTICPGLSIGNTRQVSFKRIVEKYDYEGYPVITALQDGGLKGLMNLAFKKGFVPEETYVSGCHFCYEARKFLRGIFSDAFTFLT